MAAKFSTGLRQFLANEGSMRECFGDSEIRIYPGQAPDSPDDAEVSNILCVVTADGGEVSDGEISTSEIYDILIAHSGAPDNGDKVEILVNDEAVEVVASSDTVATLAVKLAAKINLLNDVIAIPQVSTGLVLVTTEVAGIPLTITSNTPTGGISNTCTARQAASRSDALYFDAGVLGIMNKAAAIDFIGENILGGTAGHFRLVRSDDSGGESQIEKRVQGNCSTSGSEMNLSSLLFVLGADTKLKTFRITFPES